jgi:hypothetical protein
MNNNNCDWYLLIKVICSVLVVLSLTILFTLGITGKFSRKINNEKINNKNTEVHYQKILASDMFNQEESDYIVLFYDIAKFNKQMKDIEQSYSDKLYVVDLGDALNSYFIRNTLNINPSNINELSVNGPVIFKISNKKVLSTIVGENNILEFLTKKKS